MRKRIIRRAMLALGAAFIVMQSLPVRHAAAMAPAGEPIEASLAVPGDVKHLLDRACANCHSANTAFPWYARIAPVSWMIEHDIAQARQALDFSDWARTGGKSNGRAIGTLMAACASLQAGMMPPPSYRAMHPEARLSSIEINDFCAWTSVTARELRQVASRASGF